MAVRAGREANDGFAIATPAIGRSYHHAERQDACRLRELLCGDLCHVLRQVATSDRVLVERAGTVSLFNASVMLC